MDFDTPAMPIKVRTFPADELRDKLERKAALWHRTARENEERALDFERAIRELSAGATSVTVGRTTYRVDGSGDADHTEG